MKWCHTFPDLGITGSNISKEDEDFILSTIPESLEGKSVLDLASFDGFYSYEACKRSAKYVVALDNGMGEEILNGPDNGVGSANMSYPNYKERQLAFDRQYEKYKFLGKPIHLVPLNVEDMDKLVPDFDIIFCFGLYYHVTDIYGLFEKCYKKCKDYCLVEGPYLGNDYSDPSLVYVSESTEIHNDPTTFWVPTIKSLFNILLRVGFKDIKILGIRNQRVILKCDKK